MEQKTKTRTAVTELLARYRAEQNAHPLLRDAARDIVETLERKTPSEAEQHFRVIGVPIRNMEVGALYLSTADKLQEAIEADRKDGGA